MIFTAWVWERNISVSIASRRIVPGFSGRFPPAVDSMCKTALFSETLTDDRRHAALNFFPFSRFIYLFFSLPVSSYKVEWMERVALTVALGG